MKYIAVDTETNGLQWYKGHKPFLLIAYDGDRYYLDDEVKPFLTNTNIIKVFHNAKFDIHMLKNIELEVAYPIADTMIMAQLIDENQKSYALKKLAIEVLLEDNTEEKEIDAWFKANKILKKDRDYSKVPIDIMIKYAKQDVLFTYKLYEKFIHRMNDFEELYNNEMKLIRVLFNMERCGHLIDIEKTSIVEKEFEAQLLDIAREIRCEFGADFNFNSSKQLGEKLVELKEDVIYTDKGNIKTDAKTLELYNSNLVKLVTEYRKIDKIKTTYCKAFLALHVNGTIHCNYRQNKRTGRFSSSQTNLQNIPRPDENKKHSSLVRSLFIPRKGFTNYYIDYSQIEYRIAAEYFRDDELINRINNGDDLHGIQAERIFNTKEYTKDQRALAKKINFSVLYGAGVNNICKSLKEISKDMTREMALDILEKFYRENPAIRKISEQVETNIKHRGYLFNRFGRRRHMRKDEAYKGFNSLCQGTAADIIKFAMVRIDYYLENYKSNLLLNIHDELVFEIADGEEYLIDGICNLMTDFKDRFTVNIAVDVSYTDTNWAEKRAYERKRIKN